MSLFGGSELGALQDLLQEDPDELAPSQSIVASVGPRSLLEAELRGLEGSMAGECGVVVLAGCRHTLPAM